MIINKIRLLRHYKLYTNIDPLFTDILVLRRRERSLILNKNNVFFYICTVQLPTLQ